MNKRIAWYCVCIVVVFFYNACVSVSNAFAEVDSQKIVFCFENIKYGSASGASDCQQRCNKHTCDLNSLSHDGWKIVTTTPSKEIVELTWQTVYSDNAMHLMPGIYGCTCIGTQYGLQKE
jgi:hypothetical protein